MHNKQLSHENLRKKNKKKKNKKKQKQSTNIVIQRTSNERRKKLP